MFFFGKKKNKKPQAEISHYCFITEEGKWKNLLATLKERQGLGTLWILAHFEQTMADFQTKLDELGITYEEKRHRFGELVICLAKDVSTSITNASEVWCLEEHPLHSEKEALLEKLAEYGVKELKVYLGLNEQIFESFNEGNRIGQMITIFRIDQSV